MEDRFKFRFWNNKNMIYDDIPHLEFYNSDDYIWQQCTGLKDKNGKLIYEGDIVKTFIGDFIIKYCDICKSYQLFSVEGNYCFSCEGDLHWFEFLEDLDKTKVIGNIYENKELLNA